MLRGNQRLRRNQQRLFERILAGHGRVRHAVGEHQPRGKRRKFEKVLRAVLLKCGVFFQVIVKPKHEHVIRRAAHSAEAELVAPILHRAADPGIFGDSLKPRLGCVLPRKNLKALRRVPDARFGRIQIREDAE